MQWTNDLFFNPNTVAHAVLMIALVTAAGLALGSIKFRGLGLGIAGVLFAGLLAGHLGVKIEHNILDFCREFGLILFVYTIGMQVGPGFFASLKRQGLPLNTLAACVVLSGAGITVLLWWLVMGGKAETLPAAVGLLSGATTNTPSLASAQEALRQWTTASETSGLTTGGGAGEGAGGTGGLGALPGQAYAVAYPFGIVGIILSMLLTKWLFRIDLKTEKDALEAEAERIRPKLENVNLEVRNPNLAGLKLKDIRLLSPNSAVISRIYRQGHSELAKPDSQLNLGDVIHAVGHPAALGDLKILIGGVSNIDVRTVPSDIIAKRLLVSKRTAIGRTLAELSLRERFGVNITRINRSGIDLPVSANMRLAAGDYVTVVGDESGIGKLASEVGNSPKQLDTPHVIGLFVGIALGVFLGSIPLMLPGMPAAVKLGLAGGPLIVAILLSYVGRIGPLIYYMPMSANLMLREIGIVMFLACVGIKGGATFVSTLQENGLLWLGVGALITFVPMMTVGLIGRGIMKLNYLTLCGLMAGSMTDPPALAFAGSISGSDAPSVSYATVYPLVMLLRVLSTQAIVLLLMG